MGIQKEGIEAEQWLLKIFRDNNIECFQPDAISLEHGQYVLNEVKHQEYYESPPFDGHGLPKWQIEARLHFYNLTGIRCRLVIKDKKTGVVYWQWFDELELGDFYDTEGDNKRRVYPLTNYRKGCKRFIENLGKGCSVVV